MIGKYRGPETQVLRPKCSNTRGPETQVLRAKYRGPETQVLKAKCSNTRHGRIVSDRHGYPLVVIEVRTEILYKVNSIVVEEIRS